MDGTWHVSRSFIVVGGSGPVAEWSCGCLRWPFGFPFPAPDSHLEATTFNSWALCFCLPPFFPNSKPTLLFLVVFCLFLFFLFRCSVFVNLLCREQGLLFLHSLTLLPFLPSSSQFVVKSLLLTLLWPCKYCPLLSQCVLWVCFLSCTCFWFVFPRVNNCLIFVWLVSITDLSTVLSPRELVRPSTSLCRNHPPGLLFLLPHLNLAVSACCTAPVLGLPWFLSCAGTLLSLVPYLLSWFICSFGRGHLPDLICLKMAVLYLHV